MNINDMPAGPLYCQKHPDRELIVDRHGDIYAPGDVICLACLRAELRTAEDKDQEAYDARTR